MPGITTKFRIVNSVKEGYADTNYVFDNHIGKLCYDTALTVYGASHAHGRPGYNINTSTVGNLAITPHNFERAVAVMVVAWTLENSFIDQKDFFYQPNTEHSEWRRFVVDSVIFSLFCGGSAHISRYDVEWDNRIHLRSDGNTNQAVSLDDKLKYQIPNEFFWMPMDYMRGMAQFHENAETLRSLDIIPKERFVQQWFEKQSPIEQIASPEAMVFIQQGTDLLTTTFRHRAEFDQIRPEVQICNWDAGWWQLKELWKIVAKDKLEELIRLRKILKKSIQQRLRLLGWLRSRSE
jgi:hypothetical protein